MLLSLRLSVAGLRTRSPSVSLHGVSGRTQPSGELFKEFETEPLGRGSGRTSWVGGETLGAGRPSAQARAGPRVDLPHRSFGAHDLCALLACGEGGRTAPPFGF